MRAVHRGELFGVAPTGRRIEMHGFDLFHRRDGKPRRIAYDGGVTEERLN
jgi:hypothetical protein